MCNSKLPVSLAKKPKNARKVRIRGERQEHVFTTERSPSACDVEIIDVLIGFSNKGIQGEYIQGVTNDRRGAVLQPWIHVVKLGLLTIHSSFMTEVEKIFHISRIWF